MRELSLSLQTSTTCLKIQILGKPYRSLPPHIALSELQFDAHFPAVRLRGARRGYPMVGWPSVAPVRSPQRFAAERPHAFLLF